MPFGIQDLVVTALALGAIGILVSRIVGVLRPTDAKPGCASCASGAAACAHPAPQQQQGPVPLVLHRRGPDHAVQARASGR